MVVGSSDGRKIKRHGGSEILIDVSSRKRNTNEPRGQAGETTVFFGDTPPDRILPVTILESQTPALRGANRQIAVGPAEPFGPVGTLLVLGGAVLSGLLVASAVQCGLHLWTGVHHELAWAAGTIAGVVVAMGVVLFFSRRVWRPRAEAIVARVTRHRPWAASGRHDRNRRGRRPEQGRGQAPYVEASGDDRAESSMVSIARGARKGLSPGGRRQASGIATDPRQGCQPSRTGTGSDGSGGDCDDGAGGGDPADSREEVRPPAASSMSDRQGHPMTHVGRPSEVVDRDWFGRDSAPAEDPALTPRRSSDRGWIARPVEEAEASRFFAAVGQDVESAASETCPEDAGPLFEGQFIVIRRPQRP